MTVILTRLRGLVARFARARGYEITRIAPPTEARRIRREWLDGLAIDTVLDVGANDGAFARELRADGFEGRIVSFEPTSDAFTKLERQSKSDPLWSCLNLALGSEEGSVQINIAGNSSSSSILPMTEIHARSAPESPYVSTENVRIATLDSLREFLQVNRGGVFMKIDVQGYELEVLNGAASMLDAVDALECELSFVALYQGQELFQDVVDWLRGRGFVLRSIDEVHHDAHTGELLQVNGLFGRSTHLGGGAPADEPC